jgi:hypothetical protein
VIPLVGGPLEALVIAGFAVAGVFVWLRRRRRYPGPRLVDDRAGIDHAALAEAEREVRQAPSDAALKGPGTPAVGSPPLPWHTRSAQTSDRDRSGS